MPDYQRYPVSTDPIGDLNNFVADLQTYWPAWEPSEGSLAYRAAVALINIVAEGRDVGSLIPDEVFRRIGVELFNYPSFDALPALADTTWTMADDAGYGTIPAGTLVSISGVFFETIDDIDTISGTTVYGPIGIQATTEGEANNNLGTPGGTVDLEEPYEFVDSITQIAATSQGQDQEPLQTYLTRLREYLTLLTPRAISAQNLGVLARTVPGVERALVIKGLVPEDHPNPGDPEMTDQEGVATVIPVDAVGGDVPSGAKDTLNATLMGPGDRLINSVIYIIDATRTPVDVTWEGVAVPGADPAEVQAQGNGAVAALFDPNLWGQRTSGETREWYMKRTVRRSDIIGALESVEGLDYVDEDSLAIGLDGGAQANANVDLPGYGPLPLAGAIVGTVTAP